MLILILLLLIFLLQLTRPVKVASDVPLIKPVSAFEFFFCLAQIREHTEDRR